MIKDSNPFAQQHHVLAGCLNMLKSKGTVLVTVQGNNENVLISLGVNNTQYIEVETLFLPN